MCLCWNLGHSNVLSPQGDSFSFMSPLSNTSLGRVEEDIRVAGRVNVNRESVVSRLLTALKVCIEHINKPLRNVFLPRVMASTS